MQEATSTTYQVIVNGQRVAWESNSKTAQSTYNWYVETNRYGSHIKLVAIDGSNKQILAESK